MEWFVENWKLLLWLVFAIASLVVSVFLFFKTKDVKYLKEVFNMFKFGTPPEKISSYQQSFSNLKPVYRLNKATNELEKTDDVIDISELVNSCKDVCLQACLERFIPADDSSDDLNLYSDMLDDLDVMRDVLDRVEDYREAFGLDGASVEEVFDYVGQHAEELKKKLDSAENKKNGGLENGKVQTPQSDQSAENGKK